MIFSACCIATYTVCSKIKKLRTVDKYKYPGIYCLHVYVYSNNLYKPLIVLHHSLDCGDHHSLNICACVCRSVQSEKMSQG